MKRFSTKELMKAKFGESEKSTKNARSTKKAKSKAEKGDGKYITKIVDGVKYIVLK